MSIDLTHVETSRAAIETNLLSSLPDLDKLANLYGEFNTFKKDLSDLIAFIRDHTDLLGTEAQREPVLSETGLIYGTMSSAIVFINGLISGEASSVNNKDRANLVTSAMACDSMAQSVETICNNIQINTNVNAINDSATHNIGEIVGLSDVLKHINKQISDIYKHI